MKMHQMIREIYQHHGSNHLHIVWSSRLIFCMRIHRSYGWLTVVNTEKYWRLLITASKAFHSVKLARNTYLIDISKDKDELYATGERTGVWSVTAIDYRPILKDDLARYIFLRFSLMIELAYHQHVISV